MTRRHVVAALITLAVAAGISSAHAGKIYWSTWGGPNQSALQRAGLDGSNIEDVVQGATAGVSIDSIDRKVYWNHYSDQPEGTPSIRRANLNGTGTQILYQLGGFLPGAMALDRPAGKLYVSIAFFEGCVGIYRFPMNGTGDFEDGVRIVPGVCALGIAVDSAAGKLYWTGYYETSIGIHRANLDGSSPETVIAVDASPWGLALDAARGKVYWLQTSVPEIVLRADLDGSNPEVLISGEPQFGRGLALDLRSDKVYWAFQVFPLQGIARANLDGSDPETVLAVGSEGQIAIDPLDGSDVPAVSFAGLVALVLLIFVAARRGVRSHISTSPGAGDVEM